MSFEEQEVTVARWELAVAAGTGAAARSEVVAFARRHGMAETVSREVGVAVSEAVPYVADGSGTPHPRVVVEAATDGEWLSVRLDGEADRAGSDADVVLNLPLVLRFAHRFEYGTRWPGTGTSVLMEFAMGRAQAPACADGPPYRRAATTIVNGSSGTVGRRLSGTRPRRRRRGGSTQRSF